MKQLKLLLLAVVVLLATVAAAPGAPAAVLPTPPVPTFPGRNALTTDYTPTLKWGGSTPTTGVDIVTDYEWEVWEDAYFSTVMVESGSEPYPTRTVDMTNTLDPHRVYYWRVRANNASGSSAWRTSYFRTSVEQPTLTAPADLGVLVTNRPTFQWSSVDSATSYSLQISHYSNFSSAAYSYTIPFTATEYTMLVDLPSNRTMYWRVRANSTTYGPGLFSAVFTFTTASPPSIPVLLQPRTGKYTDDYTPLLTWKQVTMQAAAPIFDHYEIQFATTKKFDADVFTLNEADIPNMANIDEPFADIPDANELTPNTIYYWRVRAYNSLAQYSSWSTPFELRTTVGPVTALLAPPDDEVLEVNCPMLDWTPVDGAGQYHIQISRNAAFTAIVRTYVAKGPPKHCGGALIPGVKYYWRVRAIVSSINVGRWSAGQSFTAANPPSVPRLYLPGNNALTTNYTPLLAWFPSKVPAGKIFAYYQIQVSDNDPSFSAPLIDDMSVVDPYTTNLTVAPALDPAHVYYWRVRACTDTEAGPPAVPVQCSNWSLVYKLRTGLEEPVNLSPAGGSSIAVGAFPIIFEWDPVTGATMYYLDVSRYSNMRYPVRYVIPVPSPQKILPSLRVGTYYWRVFAVNKLFGARSSLINQLIVTP